MRRFRGMPPLIFGFLAVFTAVPVFYLGSAQRAAFFYVLAVVLVISGGFLMGSGLTDRKGLTLDDPDERELAFAQATKLSRIAGAIFMIGGLIAVLVGF